MTDKRFYGEAFDEVQNGKIDHPLWVKVTSENAQADKATIQAAYISSRAQELALENTRKKITQAKQGLQSGGQKLVRPILFSLILIVGGFFVIGGSVLLYFSATKVHHLINNIEGYQVYVEQLRVDTRDNPQSYYDPSGFLEQSESQMSGACNLLRDAQREKSWYPFPDQEREAKANDDCRRIWQVVRQNQR